MTTDSQMEQEDTPVTETSAEAAAETAVETAVENAVESDPQPGLGAQMRQVREAAGLSVGDVSQALKFSSRQIEALELDDYSQLQGRTFVRGFVRSYARFLHMDEAPLLAQLQQENPAPVDEVRPVESVGAEMPDHSSPVVPHRVRAGVLVAVAAIALAGVAVYGYQAEWYHFPEPQSGEVSKESVAASVEPKSESNAAPAVLNIAQPALQVVPDAQPSAGASTEAASTAAATPASPDERLLQLTFSGESWVEVRDARQVIVLSGKYAAGAQQQARGKAPFQVVVGNAPMVKLTYEGRTIDLQPFTRAEVARMTLDDNSK